MHALLRLTLTKSAIGAGVDRDGVLGGVEEVEHQSADRRILEHLNNAGGQTEGCSVN